MAFEGCDMCVVTISRWDTFMIHFYSFLLGTWTVIRKCLSSLISSKRSSIKSRSKPPLDYVDSSLGSHSSVKINKVKFHYVQSGDPKKPLVLLLHGFPDCWYGWRYQMPLLSNHFRVVALDLKGFGDSDKPAWRRSYRLEMLLDELREFIRDLGAERCTLIGHDLGALLGWYMVHKFPEIVDKFVCISCPHPNLYWHELPRSSEFNSSWVNFCQLPYLPETEALRDDMSIINKCYVHLKKKDDSCIDAYKYIFARPEDWTGPINYYRNLPFIRVNGDVDIVQVPCLFITGNKDPYANLESVVKSAEYVEKYTVKIVDGAGHFPHQEMPECVNIHLLSFLIVPKAVQKVEKASPKQGLMTRMFGAVSSTVRYGNGVLDIVQKRTNGVIRSLPANTVPVH